MMPRRKITHNRTDVRAMWELMEKMGQEPVSVKYHPDGTFRIMTRKHAEITGPHLSTSVGNPWDEVLTDAPA